MLKCRPVLKVLGNEDTWEKFSWLDWIPAIVRQDVERYWCKAQRRAPLDWLLDAEAKGVPVLGLWVMAISISNESVEGRFVHAWNNLGRVVARNGNVIVVREETCTVMMRNEFGFSIPERSQKVMHIEGGVVYPAIEW